MEVAASGTPKEGDDDSGVGSLNSGGQTVICIYVPKHDVKVTANYNNKLAHRCRHFMRLSAWSCAALTLTFDLLNGKFAHGLLLHRRTFKSILVCLFVFSGLTNLLSLFSLCKMY